MYPCQFRWPWVTLKGETLRAQFSHQMFARTHGRTFRPSSPKFLDSCIRPHHLTYNARSWHSSPSRKEAFCGQACPTSLWSGNTVPPDFRTQNCLDLTWSFPSSSKRTLCCYWWRRRWLQRLKSEAHTLLLMWQHGPLGNVIEFATSQNRMFAYVMVIRRPVELRHVGV